MQDTNPGDRVDRSLSFDPVHADPIRHGDKTKTVRLSTEISPNRRVAFVTDSGESFGEAKIQVVGRMSALDFIADGWHEDGYPGTSTVHDLLESLREYYPEADLDPSTEIAMIEWRDFTEYGDYFADYPTRSR
jgi:hypothetical protein